MCSIHNKVVDSDEATYTVERLKEMKADHEATSKTIAEENVKLAVELLISGDGTATTQARDITVTVTNPQNRTFEVRIVAPFVEDLARGRPSLLTDRELKVEPGEDLKAKWGWPVPVGHGELRLGEGVDCCAAVKHPHLAYTGPERDDIVALSDVEVQRCCGTEIPGLRQVVDNQRL